MPTKPDLTKEPCPHCKHVGGVARIQWGDAFHVIYYRCAGCGHVWATDREGNPKGEP